MHNNISLLRIKTIIMYDFFLRTITSHIHGHLVIFKPYKSFSNKRVVKRKII